MDDALGLMLRANEALRLRFQRQTLLARDALPPAAQLALPPAIALPASPVPEVAANVVIEPLAEHVPESCFYVRLGSYANFQWLRNFLSQAGGDVTTLITHRSMSYKVNARLERQLILKSSVLADLLGGLVISDVALIGSDALMRDGAAMGVLFEARNSGLLTGTSRSSGQNAGARTASHGAASGDRRAQGVVHFHARQLHSHILRGRRRLSFRRHFAGAGRAVLRGRGGERLAGPVARVSYGARAIAGCAARHDFLFLSTPFLAQLTSPHYRVETNRRLVASGKIELVYLAQLAARGEGKPAEAIEQLIAGGFLPPHFGRGAEGSRIVFDGKTAVRLAGPARALPAHTRCASYRRHDCRN